MTRASGGDICTEVRSLSLGGVAQSPLATAEDSSHGGCDNTSALTVETADGERLSVQANLQVDTVAALKAKLENLSSIPVSLQQLLAGTAELDDDEPRPLGEAYPQLIDQTMSLKLVVADAVGVQRLPWYDELLSTVARCEASELDWKAWANRGTCLYKLGEKKASWDAYRQAAFASRGFRVDICDDDMLKDPHVGKNMRILDREFRLDGWSSNDYDDITLFALLVQRGRGSEVATQRWHETMPSHYFSVTQALCRKLTSQGRAFEQVHVDDTRMELQRGNTLALVASTEAMFVQREGSKRARLADSVQDVYVEIQVSRRGSSLDFGVEELEQE